MLVKADGFFVYCQPIWKIDVCQIGCFSGYVCEQDKKSLKPLSAIMFWHPSKNWNQCPFTPEGLFTLWSSEVTILGQTLRTESQCVVILLMVQKSGWPVDMENLRFLTRLYISKVVIAGFLNHQQSVVWHSSRLSDFTCQYLFMLFKNLSAVLPATHFEPLWQELNSP